MAEAFDTHAAYRELTENGKFTSKQAEAMVALFSTAITSNLATKADLDHMRTELKADIDVLRIEMKSDNESLRTELKSDIKTLKAQVWQVAAGGAVVVIGIIKLLDYLLPTI